MFLLFYKSKGFIANDFFFLRLSPFSDTVVFVVFPLVDDVVLLEFAEVLLVNWLNAFCPAVFNAYTTSYEDDPELELRVELPVGLLLWKRPESLSSTELL